MFRDARAATARRPLARGPVTRHTVARIEGHERIGAGLISSTIRCTNASAVPACATKSRPPPPAWSLARCRVHCTRSVPTTAAELPSRPRTSRSGSHAARGLHCLPSPRVKTTKWAHARSRIAAEERCSNGLIIGMRIDQSMRRALDNSARWVRASATSPRRRRRSGIVRRPCLRRTSGEYQQRQLSRALASEVARDVDTDSSQ